MTTLIKDPTMLHEVRHNGVHLVREYAEKTGNRKAAKLARSMINKYYSKLNKEYHAIPYAQAYTRGLKMAELVKTLTSYIDDILLYL